MLKRTLTAVLLVVCILMLTGCSCNHVWTEADCVNAKTCSKCQETQGTALGHDWRSATCKTAKSCTRCTAIQGVPLGHTLEKRTKITDLVTCSAFTEQYCTVCNLVIASNATTLDTLVQDNLFLFTPEEFVKRLTLIAEQNSFLFTYACVPSGTGLQMFIDASGKQSIIQFFRNDTTPLAGNEMNNAEVWCVSLISIGDSDADFRHYFFMACDPTLDKNTAFETDKNLSINYMNATTQGESFGYHLHNQLLYETILISEGTSGYKEAMTMVNIYASDFR